MLAARQRMIVKKHHFKQKQQNKNKQEHSTCLSRLLGRKTCILRCKINWRANRWAPHLNKGGFRSIACERQLVENIGGLETQKHSLLHKIAEVNQEVEKLKVELEKEYGKVSIDLETGEIKEIEDKKEE